MPRQITTTVYTYEELTDAAKKKARDAWRELDARSGDNSWAEFTEESFKGAAIDMGWNVTNVAWSGFASQGDGAQFEGDWSATRVNEAGLKKSWLLFKEGTSERIDEPAYRINEKLHRLVDQYAALGAKYPEGTAAVVRNDRTYAHSNATGFSVDFGTDNEINEFIAISRQLMDLFYRMLEQEYNYTQSDDYVAERIIANENEFTVGGKIV
jgi:hypothetical protein